MKKLKYIIVCHKYNAPISTLTFHQHIQKITKLKVRKYTFYFLVGWRGVIPQELNMEWHLKNNIDITLYEGDM